MDPVTRNTYEEAEAECLRMLKERKDGTAAPRGTSRLTLREYGEQSYKVSQPWAPATLDLFSSRMNKHIYPILGDTPLQKLEKDQIQHVITHLTKGDGTPVAANTARSVLQLLNQVLNAAVANGKLTRNPAKGVQPPVGGGGKGVTIPTVEQVHALAEVIEPPSRALIAVGSGLGLRQGEAFALRRSRINFMKGTVLVNAKVRTDKAGWMHLDAYTKNRRTRKAVADSSDGARVVPMPKVVADELARHIKEYDIGSTDLLFTWPKPLLTLNGEPRNYHPDGNLMHSRNWNDGPWLSATTQVGLQGAGFHCLRHFCATSMLRNKVSVAAVAKALGDNQITIHRYYSHVIEDDTDLIRAVLDEVLSTHGDTGDEAAF
jgi:integrase